MAAKNNDAIKPMPETRWSLIDRAENGDTFVRRQALSELLQQYMPALHAHLILEKQIPDEQANELLQSFVLDKILEKSILAAADQKRGRFRNLLIASLGNYVISRQRYNHAVKRNPGEMLSLDSVQEIVECPGCPREAFDAAWVRQLIGRAIAMMQSRCKDLHREDLWEVFQSRVLIPLFENSKPLSYEKLVEKFGFESPAKASNVLITAKRTFERILRELIAEYEREDDIEGEINDLYRILSRSSAGKSFIKRI